MPKLAHQIRQHRADIYQTFPSSVRTLHALVRIAAHADGRRKKAYSASTITKLVDSELRKIGVKDAPSINWGAIFHTAVAQMSRKLNLDQTQREDFLADVVSDMIMGQSITTVRDTGPWKRTVSQQLEEWIKAGWDDNRIKATLTKFVKDKTYNIYRRWVKMNEGADVSFESGKPGDDYQGSAVFEGLFSLDELSSSQMGSYHSLMRQNPEVKNLVQKIEKVLSRKDDDMGLIWQAYTADPDASMKELLTVPVRVQGQRVPLQEALGLDPTKNNKQNLYNRVKKLRSLLQRLWPDIDSTLRDIMYA